MAVRIDNLSNLYTLMLLHSKPRHGYEIMRNIEEKLGKRASPGQVYPFIKKLQNNRYLTAKKSGSRDRKVYSLTPRGRKFVDEILTKFDNILRLAIESKIRVCAHCGCEVYRGWHIEKIRGRKLVFCCKGCAASYR